MVSRCGVGGIEEVNIGMDVANVKECHEEKEIKPMRAQEQPAGETITNGIDRRKWTEEVKV